MVTINLAHLLEPDNVKRTIVVWALFFLFFCRAEGLTFDHGMTRHSFDLNISSHAATGVEEASPNITMVSALQLLSLEHTRV